MITKTYKDIEFVITGEKIEANVSDEVLDKYLDAVKENAGKKEVTSVKLTQVDENNVEVEYSFDGRKFERIRRITGKADMLNL